MKKISLFLLIFSLLSLDVNAGKLSKLVRDDGELIDIAWSQSKSKKKVKPLMEGAPAVADGTSFEVKPKAIQKLIKSKKEHIRLNLLLSGKKETLLLKRNEPFNFKTEGSHYVGQVKGDDSSVVSISLVDSKVRGKIDFDGKSYSLNTEGGVTFVRDVTNEPSPVPAISEDAIEAPNAIIQQESGKNLPSSEQSPTVESVETVVNPTAPVNVCFVATYRMYQTLGSSVSAVTSMQEAIWPNVAALYLNEGVNVKMGQQTKVWTTQDPYGAYNETNSSVLLGGFATKEPIAAGCHLMHLLTIVPGMGGVAYLSVLGNPYYAHGLSSIYSTFVNDPIWNWPVSVETHELGHNLSSKHTQACTWNVNGLANQALDGCYSVEGTCTRPPQPTTRVGTIMSYCHLLGLMDLRLGFGPQPRAKIQSFIQQNLTYLGDNGTGPDTIAPIISMVAPINGSTIAGTGPGRTISFTADARDNRAMSKVDFQVTPPSGAAFILSDVDYPYGVNWDSAGKPNGSYSVRAKAFDAAGNASQYTGNVLFTLANAPQDVTKPVVTINSPVNGSTWTSGTKIFAASATDNVGVTFLSLYANNALFGNQSGPGPISRSIDYGLLPTGTTVIKATAKDSDGNLGEASVTISIGGGVDTIKPTVSVTSPINNSTVSGVVAFGAVASDNLAVDKVEFYVDNSLISSDFSSPYMANWDSKLVANGSKVLKAKAYDQAGNFAEYSLLVNVQNAVVPAGFSICGQTVGQNNAISDTTKRNWVDVKFCGLVGNPTGAGKAKTATAWSNKSGADFVKQSADTWRAFYWNPNMEYQFKGGCPACTPAKEEIIDFKTLQ